MYSQARDAISSRLNREAQKISDNRQAFETALRVKQKLEEYQRRLSNGQVDQADLKTVRDDVNRVLDQLRKRSNKCKDSDVLGQIREVGNLGSVVKQELADPKRLKKAKTVANIETELNMTSKTRKVFEIIMDTLQNHFEDKSEYYAVASKIYSALRKKY